MKKHEYRSVNAEKDYDDLLAMKFESFGWDLYQKQDLVYDGGQTGIDNVVYTSKKGPISFSCYDKPTPYHYTRLSFRRDIPVDNYAYYLTYEKDYDAHMKFVRILNDYADYCHDKKVLPTAPLVLLALLFLVSAGLVGIATGLHKTLFDITGENKLPSIICFAVAGAALLLFVLIIIGTKGKWGIREHGAKKNANRLYGYAERLRHDVDTLTPKPVTGLHTLKKIQRKYEGLHYRV